MRLILICLLVAFLSSPTFAAAQARLMRVIPANPVALEIVHVELEVNICYRVRGVELIENGLRVLLHGDDRNAYCDYDNNYGSSGNRVGDFGSF